MTDAFKRAFLTFVQRRIPIAGPSLWVDLATRFAVRHGVPGVVHVTRRDDVLEVLTRDDDFSVRLYDEKMTETTGPFFLGMNALDRYDPEAKIAYRAFRADDLRRVRDIARQSAEQALDRARSSGRLDVVRDLAELVPLDVVSRYLGVPCNDRSALLELFQRTSQHVFSFWPDPDIRSEAIAAAQRVRRELDAAVADRRAAADPGDDILGRFVADQNGFDDEGIARTLAGLASGAINPPLGLLVQAVDVLMDQPEETRERLHRAAGPAGDGDADALRLVEEHVLEAERFVVYPPFSYRFCERAATLAAETDRRKTIPRGTTVVTWQSLAAFDAAAIDEPWTFRPGRPKDHYLIFGHARHHCLGERVGQTVIVETIRQLFTLPGLRRAPGRAGQIEFADISRGRYPRSFSLQFDR